MNTTIEYINQLKKDKENLNTMLNNMGVETTGNETFTELTPLVGKIVTEPILQDKSITITENGTTNIVADEGYNGLSSVNILTNIIGGDEVGVLLWSNPSPTSNFVSQTITLNSDDYDVLEFYYKKVCLENDIGNNVILTSKTIKGYDVQLSNVGVLANSGIIYHAGTYRVARYVSDTSYNIGAATFRYGDTNSFDSNAYLIPLYVVGYKTGLFN